MRSISLILCLFPLFAYGQSAAKYKIIIDSLHAKGKCNEAITLIDSRMAANPNNDTIFYYKGWLKIHCSIDYQSALNHFESLLANKPSSVLGNLGKGMSLCFLEKPYEAIDYLEIARSYQPKLFEVQYYLGYAYYLLGKSDKRQYKNAISHFNKAIKIKEYSPEIYFYRGISQFFGGDVLKANKDFENYDKYAIDSVRTTEFYLYRGITLYHLKKIDEAEKWLANIPQSDSLYSEVLYLRGISLLRDNKPEAAFNDLNKYLKLKPNNPNLHADIAEYYFNNEDLDLAYIYYNKAAKLAHPASQQIMRNYHDSKKSKRKLKKINITFEISRNWLVDEFSEKESISNCKGAVIYDIADRLFISILENPALSSDPKATCSMWGHEFNTNGVEDEYKTSQYIWQRKISNETWTPESGEAYPIKVWRLLPNLINNQLAVFIWGNPADMELFDFYIHDLLESLKIRR